MIHGCVYAAPVPRAQDAGPRDLTVDEIGAMALTGLPVRVEHGSRAVVGRVAASRTRMPDGYTTVDIALDDTVEGHAARALIDQRMIRDLSLCHTVHGPLATKTPVEVSLVKEGAREGTHLFILQETKYVRDAREETKIMASAAPLPTLPTRDESTGQFVKVGGGQSEQPPAAAPADEARVDHAVPTLEVGAPEGTLKRARDEDSQPEPAGIIDKIDAIAANLSADKRADLFTVMQQFVSERNSASTRADQLEHSNKALESIAEQSKSTRGDWARSMVSVLNDLFHSVLDPKDVLSDDVSSEMACGFEHLAQSHPKACEGINRLTVACSRIMEARCKDSERARTEESKKTEAANEYAARCRDSFMKLHANPAALPPAPWLTPVAAAPQLVAASKRTAAAPHAPAARFVPDWLKDECGSFKEAGSVGRVAETDVFTRRVAARTTAAPRF